MTTIDGFGTPVENQWCPGCPNFGLQAALKRALVDLDLERAVELELAELGLRANAEVAVRSSSSVEDSQEAAFAGIFETYRVEATKQQVLAAIGRVFASRYSDLALAYARALHTRRGLAVPLLQPMAVLIQEYIQGLFGGVVFTKNPMRTDQGVVEIAAVLHPSDS